MWIPLIGYAKYDDKACILVGNTHIIPLGDKLAETLETAQNLYIAIGNQSSYNMINQGSITLDKIMVGKLLAYADMDKQAF